ncbi:MAG: SpoIIE family protein phosphatase [Acidobacteriaceae bacterium]|nr:SpoIIE family protein phosphatase [Acidobacteriaceae bacterium]
MATAAAGFGKGDLIIDSPGSTSMFVHLERDRYTLGRSSANDLAFPGDQKLSREHLVFERTTEGWTVQDLGSRNGTRVNEVRLTQVTRLAHGDQITAGNLRIRYDALGEFTEAKPHEITFFEEGFTRAVPAVSLDLKSVLETSTDVAGRPALENAQLRALVRAGQELAGHGELEKLFELVLDLSLAAVTASRGVVMTNEGDAGLKTRAIRGEGLRISTGVRDLVMSKGRSILIRDARLDQDFGFRESILAQEIRSVLAVPLQTNERVIGLLYLDSPHLVREFTTEDLNLVTVMANIAAIRIEHARLVEQEEARRMLARELERAAEIQRRLLPSMAPEIAGFDLGGYNAPCRTVGGDYYDFLPYPDGRVTVLIGDVSGKGLGAALLMSNLQACAHVLFEDPEPFETQVCRLNRSIAANCPRDAFITLFAALLDPASGELAYCNAGHNAPLLVRSDGKMEPLGATGLPLGIMRDAGYERKSCCLAPGDVLVLFSDGVTEACASNEDEEFGEQRLVAAVQQKRNHSAAKVIEGINAELVSFTRGAPAADDITLVIVRRC